MGRNLVAVLYFVATVTVSSSCASTRITDVVTQQPTAVPTMSLDLPERILPTTSIEQTIQVVNTPTDQSIKIAIKPPLPSETTIPTVATTHISTTVITPVVIPANSTTVVINIPESASIPILMYHYISIPPTDADRYRIDLSVEPIDFEEQMKYLSQSGYRAISLYDLYGHLALNAPLPPKPIILTFDDGYRDAYVNAFPILKKYGMSGTFFIVSDFINSGSTTYLTWDMVKEMSLAGMDIESHSRTHPDMRNKSIDYLVWQILGPIEAISAYTGIRPHFFCYPSGEYDEMVMRVLKSADVWGAVTTQYGVVHTLDDAMEWSRVRIRHSNTLQQFAALVE